VLHYFLIMYCYRLISRDVPSQCFFSVVRFDQPNLRDQLTFSQPFSHVTRPSRRLSIHRRNFPRSRLYPREPRAQGFTSPSRIAP